jgi:adenosylcobinamide-phosphate synthase
LALLLAVLAVDFAIGCLPPIARLASTPFRLADTLFAWLDGKLNRTQRSAAVRFIRGVVVLVFVTAVMAAIAYLLATGTARGTRLVVDGVIVFALLGGRQVLAEVAAVGGALSRQGGDAARRLLGAIAPYPTDAFDEHAVARGAIQLAAHRFLNGLVAPGFWYVVAGLPGFLVYVGVGWLAGRGASPYLPKQAFGTAPRLVLYLLEIVPAALAALLLSVAAIFVPAASPLRAVRTLVADGHRYGAHGAGWSIAAVAGGLGLALAGPRRFGAVSVATPWIGQGRARAEATDVRRAIYLVAIAWLLLAVGVGALALASAGG